MGVQSWLRQPYHGRYTTGPYDYFSRSNYLQWLWHHFDQLYPSDEQYLLPNDDAIFQDDNAPIHTFRIVQYWFYVHEGDPLHIPWIPHLLLISNSLWSILEKNVLNHYPSPSSLAEIVSIFQEEWYNGTKFPWKL